MPLSFEEQETANSKKDLRSNLSTGGQDYLGNANHLTNAAFDLNSLQNKFHEAFTGSLIDFEAYQGLINKSNKSYQDYQDRGGAPRFSRTRFERHDIFERELQAGFGSVKKAQDESNARIELNKKRVLERGERQTAANAKLLTASSGARQSGAGQQAGRGGTILGQLSSGTGETAAGGGRTSQPGLSASPQGANFKLGSGTIAAGGPKRKLGR